MNKKISILLLISLALNLFLIGFIVGHRAPNPALLFGKEPRDHFAKKEEKLLEALSDENKEKGREVFAQLRQIRENDLAKSADVLNQLKQIVSAETFNQDEFLETMSELDQSMVQVKRNSDQVIANFLTTLSQKERINLVEKFQEMHQRRNREMPLMPAQIMPVKSGPDQQIDKPQPPIPPINESAK